MLRSTVSLLLSIAITVFMVEPSGLAQYPDSQAGYGQQYPVAPGYPPQASYPQQSAAGQGPYPQGPYPQNTQVQSAEDLPDPAADQQHGAARLSVVQGDVSVRRSDTGQFVAAVMNAPLLTQDQLQTAAGSRAEVELDAASVVRLAPNTQIVFADVEYHRAQVQLAAGSITFRVLRNSNSQVEIDTPSVAVRALGPGAFRISVLDDGMTQISVRLGQAEIFGPRGSQRVAAGQAVMVRGNPADPEFQNVPELALDQFDDWSANRDRDLLGSQSYQYVSPDIYGAEDLDHNGTWVQSQYGQAWAPQNVGSDWSPYSDGQWAYEPYYGWTWVDAAPWGWAPYHYGRWFWNGGFGWCWWPGAIASMHLWSPALVGFFGFGAGLGWVALAPFELFHSWWGRGAWRGGYGYAGFHVGDVGRYYRNAAFQGGARYASFGAFGGPNQRYAIASRGQLTSASLFHGVPVSPSHAAFQFSARQPVVNTRLATAANRTFYQHQVFRTAGTNSGGGWSRTSGTPYAGATGAFQSGTYTQRSGAAAQQGTRASGGWQRFGDPGGSNTPRQSFASPQERSGWHQFGSVPPSPQAQTPRGSANPNYGAYSNGFRGTAPNSSAQSAPRTYATPQYSQPRYSAPQQRFSAPSTPHYSAPHYSAPRSSGGGGHSGGGSHSSGGGRHR